VLGSGERPLIALKDGGRIPDPPPRGDARSFMAVAVTLTDAGRAVLGGEADAIELIGIDRWLGGTHLRPDNLWRWDGSAGRVVS